MSHNFPSHL
jgi:hypothetical protein